MKFVMVFLLSFNLFAAIPTEEGLLKNLHNAKIIDGQTIIRFKASSSVPEAVDSFYKITISNENPNVVQVLQQKYSNIQMLPNQLKNYRFEGDLGAKIKRETSLEKSTFYAALMFFSMNKGTGLESVIEKLGTTIVKTRTLYNDEKLRLLRTYRSYLASSKSKSEADSPLNPQDPKEKERVQDLFRSNSLRVSPNLQLTKSGNEFLWHADWKNVQAYFTNEERRLRIFEANAQDNAVKLEFDQFAILNGVNEFPKNMAILMKDNTLYKIQVLSVETKGIKDKPMAQKLEDLKKTTLESNSEANEPFLF